MGVTGIDHVQLAMPAGGEDTARAFYAGVLGLDEVPKPENLAARGGCWFAVPGSPGWSIGQVHLGVEADFRPARKAHPGLAVSDLGEVETALVAAGFELVRDISLPVLTRGFTTDPFGNRLELLESPAP